MAQDALANSYWVEPGRLLAGEYPGGRDEQDTNERLARLRAAGIDCFIDLTQPGEREPYAQLLPKGHEHRRLPIRDHDVPADVDQMRATLAALAEALSRGRTVYVHCRAGIGRTGTVIGCYLIAQGSDASGALTQLNQVWSGSARSTSWRTLPETPEQEQFIREFAVQYAAVPEDDALAVTKQLRERFQGALMGLAVVDALAASTQYGKPGGFAPVADLLGGGPFDLPRGAWSDDTALALCLAESLLERNGYDARDQVQRMTRWQQEGYLSATGQCVGISASVARALAAARWRRQPFVGSHDPSQLEKDPLTRVAPAVMYFFADPQKAIAVAAEAARPTCQAPGVLAACRLLAAMQHAALAGRNKAALLSPEPGAWNTAGAPERLRQIAAGSYRGKAAAQLKTVDADAFDVLEAALWALHGATNFKQGALAAVNLGGDSDAIAAIYGQLAGAYFGLSSIPLAWRRALLRQDLVTGIADRLLAQAMVAASDLA